jgi:hypothetical protein
MEPAEAFLFISSCVALLYNNTRGNNPHLTLFTIFALIVYNEHCLGDKDMVAIGSESQPP